MSEKIRMKYVWFCSLSFLLLLSCSGKAFSADEPLLENAFSLSLEELMALEVVTASRQTELLSDTVATTYVITGEQMRAMGARTIYDALALVPGIVVSGNKGGASKLFFRGMGSEYSSQILLLLDNHILNDTISGGAMSNRFDRLAVENIKRIEIVQGSGSALYGGNAFFGMINVITRKGAEVGGVEASVRSEFDEGGHAVSQYNLLYGNQFDNGWQATLNVHGLYGDGVERSVESDLLGRSGVADSREDNYDIDLQASNESFNIHARYYNGEGGTYYGLFDVLNDDSSVKNYHGFVDADYLLYSKSDLSLELRGAVDKWRFDDYYVLFPADTPVGPLTVTADLDLLTYTGELRGIYNRLRNHKITSGFMYRHELLDNTNFWLNGIVDPDNLTNVVRRDIWALYLNDNYQISNDVQATLSGRYDQYSDFGGSFNPRLGISWQISPVYKVKALYGTAFRAPDFGSQYTNTNPVIANNPDLESEEVTTWELGMSVTPQKKVFLQATLFHSKARDMVSPSSEQPKVWENFDKVTSQGLEVNFRYDITANLQFSGAYTFVDLDYSSAYPQPSVPAHSGSFVVDYRINSLLNLNCNGFAQDAAKRAEGDSRDDLPGFVVLNTTLTASITRRFDLQFSVFNLTDTRYAYAAPARTIPGDYTAPARSFMLALRYGF